MNIFVTLLLKVLHTITEDTIHLNNLGCHFPFIIPCFILYKLWVLDHSCLLSQHMHTTWEDTSHCSTMPLLFFFNVRWFYYDRTCIQLTWSSISNSGQRFLQLALQYACLWYLIGHHLGPADVVDSASNSWVMLWRELNKITAMKLY